MKTTVRKDVGTSGRSGLWLIAMLALGLAAGATPAALAQDCNGDGIPDSQQLTVPVELRSGPVDHFNTPSFANYTFTQVPAAIGDVTISLLARNNLDDLDEFGNFFINDVLVAGSLWAETGEFCSLGTWESVVIDEATWNDLRALGNGDMAMRVRYFQGGEHCGFVKTRFDADYITSNDCDGDGLLNECETEDCDGNGVFDGCQFDSDGDGVINACDLCADFDDAIDADGDTIPDACDSCPGIDDTRDCNGDGVPDCLQLTATFSFFGDTWAECTPNTDYYPPLNLPEAIGDVTVTYAFTWTENIFDADKWIDVTLNGASVGRLFDSTWACGDFLYEEITIPAAVWNVQLSTDGPTELYLLRNAASCAGTGDCAEWDSQFIEYWTVEYEFSTDVDGDGWLDGCIPGGDPNGPDTDGDGVSDNNDRSPNTIADPSLVDVYGQLLRVARFDADEDGDVDVDDFDMLDASTRDVDGDGDADLHDLASILHGARGPGVAADPAFLQELKLFKAHTFGPEDLDIKPWHRALGIDFTRWYTPTEIELAWQGGIDLNQPLLAAPQRYDYASELCWRLYGTHLATIDKFETQGVSQSRQISQLQEATAASGSAMSWIGLRWSREDVAFKWQNGQFLDASDGSLSGWAPGVQIPGAGYFTPGVNAYYVFITDTFGSGAPGNYYWLNGGVVASLGEQSIEGLVAQLPENTVPAAPQTTTETVTVTLDSSADGQTVAPGATVNWTISFEASSSDNAGLALLVTDLVQDAGNPATFDLPAGDAAPAAMQNFAAPLGFSGPAGFGGQPSGAAGARNLVEIGGAQNTFGGVSSDTSHGQGGVVVTGVGQSGGVVLANGSFTAPSTFGVYTFNLANTIASVLKSVGGPGAGSEIVPANVVFAQSGISFEVADVCVGNNALGDSDGDGVCDTAIAIDWGAGVGGEQSGSICNTRVSISPVFDGSPSAGDFSGPNYAYAPLGASQQYAGFGAATHWTATFEPPADDVLLYTYYWRGAGAGGPDPVTYAFDRPFTIVSGMAGASVAGNTLVLPASGFYRGILRFTGPVSEISVVTSATDSGAGQGLTFAMVTSSTDSDGDGVIDTCDVCPGSDDNLDADSDGIPDGCDACPDLPNVHNETQGLYYATIQEAIDGAAPGDVIQIAPCTFHEDNITLPNGVDLTLRGAGTDATVIDGGGADDSNPIIRMELSGQTSATLIENLTLRNGRATGDLGSGLYIRGTSPTVRNVHIEDCSNVASLYVYSSNSLFDRCVIKGHTGSFATVFTRAGNPLFLQCLIADNTPGFAEIRRVDTSGVATFVNCTIRGAHPLVTFAVGQIDSFNTIIDGPISGDGVVSMARCLYVGATGDNIDGVPTYVDAANGDYRLAPGSLGIDAADYDAYLAAGGGVADPNGDSRTVDDCAAADIGTGALTYLDLGAYEFQADSTDSDADGIPDNCDVCPGGDDMLDADADGVPDACDNCPDTYNPDQLDSDGPDPALLPAAAWHFDEGAGAAVADVVNGNNGALNGVFWNAGGHVGSALEFPTGGAWVSVPASADFGITDHLTISTWVKPSAFPVTISRFLTASNEAFVFRLQNRRPHFYVKKNGGLTSAIADVQLNANEWTHLTAVWDGLGDGVLRIYINGVEVPSYTVQGSVSAPLDVYGSSIILGSGGGERYEGLMDELAIFDSALTPAEIGDRYYFGIGDGIGDACDAPCGNLQLGDVDGNGVVEFADAAAMSAMLLDPTAGMADQQCAADVNEDGAINGLDIQAFLDLLLNP